MFVNTSGLWKQAGEMHKQIKAVVIDQNFLGFNFALIQRLILVANARHKQIKAVVIDQNFWRLNFALIQSLILVANKVETCGRRALTFCWVFQRSTWGTRSPPLSHRNRPQGLPPWCLNTHTHCIQTSNIYCLKNQWYKLTWWWYARILGGGLTYHSPPVHFSFSFFFLKKKEIMFLRKLKGGWEAWMPWLLSLECISTFKKESQDFRSKNFQTSSCYWITKGDLTVKEDEILQEKTDKMIKSHFTFKRFSETFCILAEGLNTATAKRKKNWGGGGEKTGQLFLKSTMTDNPRKHGNRTAAIGSAMRGKWLLTDFRVHFTQVMHDTVQVQLSGAQDNMLSWLLNLAQDKTLVKQLHLTCSEPLSEQ